MYGALLHEKALGVKCAEKEDKAVKNIRGVQCGRVTACV
jgi:hypothetical protein